MLVTCLSVRSESCRKGIQKVIFRRVLFKDRFIVCFLNTIVEWEGVWWDPFWVNDDVIVLHQCPLAGLCMFTVELMQYVGLGKVSMIVAPCRNLYILRPTAHILGTPIDT